MYPAAGSAAHNGQHKRPRTDSPPFTAARGQVASLTLSLNSTREAPLLPLHHRESNCVVPGSISTDCGVDESGTVSQYPAVDGLGVSSQSTAGTSTAAKALLSDAQPEGCQGPVAGTDSVSTTCNERMMTAYNTSVAARETTCAQQKQRLGTELDHMRQSGELFLGQFVVLPWTYRHEGGQGVVQIMRSMRSEDFVAVKFFMSRSAFDAEVELYQAAELRSIMPAIQMEVSNSKASERNSRGFPWPPCIVIEKGESLQEWKSKTQPAFSTIVDVRPVLCNGIPYAMLPRRFGIRLHAISVQVSS